MKYEESIKRLEEIVDVLSDESITLDQSVKLYSEGISLAKTCLEELNSFQNKIKVLGKDLEELESEIEEDED